MVRGRVDRGNWCSRLVGALSLQCLDLQTSQGWQEGPQEPRPPWSVSQPALSLNSDDDKRIAPVKSAVRITKRCVMCSGGSRICQGADHGEPNGGLEAELPAEFRGTAPGGGQGEAPWSIVRENV